MSCLLMPTGFKSIVVEVAIEPGVPICHCSGAPSVRTRVQELSENTFRDRTLSAKIMCALVAMVDFSHEK